MSRKIEFKPLSALEQDERNPKNHDLDTIDTSMERFGVLDPIVLDDRTGKIISGHGRYKTLTAMEAQDPSSPPEGVERNDDGEWLVPVYTGWASEDDTEAAAALIAMNRTTELGGWVDESLLDLLEELSELDEGFLGVGFTEKDLENLRSSLDAPEWDDLSDEELEDALNEADESAWPTINITVAPDIFSLWQTVPGDTPEEKFSTLMEAGGYL